MSIRVMTLVWAKSKNKRTALLLELAIADFAHDDGRGAFPSIPTLAKKTRQTDRNVQLLLDKLVESQEVSVSEGTSPYGTNEYAINVKLLESYADADANTESDDEAEATDTDESDVASGENFSPPENSRDEDAENFTGGVKNSAGTAREISPNPSLLTVSKPSDKPINKNDDDGYQNAWDELRDALIIVSPIMMERFDEMWQEHPDLRRHEFALKAMKENANPVSFRYYETCFLRYDPDKPKPTRDAKARKPQPKPRDVESIENVLAAQARRAAVLSDVVHPHESAAT